MKDIILTAVIFVLVDIIFLNNMAPFFQKMVTKIQGSQIEIDILSTILTYIILVGGLYYFIIQRKAPVSEALLLGWFVYLTYEFTNKAILKNWNYTSVLIDGLWGGALFAITTYLVYQIKARFF